MKITREGDKKTVITQEKKHLRTLLESDEPVDEYYDSLKPHAEYEYGGKKERDK